MELGQHKQRVFLECLKSVESRCGVVYRDQGNRDQLDLGIFEAWVITITMYSAKKATAVLGHYLAKDTARSLLEFAYRNRIYGILRGEILGADFKTAFRHEPLLAIGNQLLLDWIIKTTVYWPIFQNI